jgi:uncharacterized protein (TIGR01777 family)
MKTRRYVARSPMPAPREELFAWYERPGAFERLTPPFEPVELVERTGGIGLGARTVVRVHLGPVARTWIAVHTRYEPGRLFADEQVEGPFARFIQIHRMLDAENGLSVMEDEIEYALPFGFLGQAFGGGLAERRLEAMFAYRHAVLRGDLARHAPFRDRPRMHVAVSGASGLIGSALVPFLTTGGHRVTRVPHQKLGEPLPDDVDAVVHLAGAPIAEGRWTEERKAEIRESRVNGTRALCEALARSPKKPHVLVSGSALGIYGDRGSESLVETSAPGSGFLADVTRAWEEATRPAEEAGIRVVHLRTGIVLSPRGGALKALMVPFKMGVGGKVGPGTQMMSRISIEDEIGLIHRALFDETLCGPLNATAPNPVSNAEFTRVLAEVLHRPHVASVPAPAMKAALGAEKAESMLLESARVIPQKALKAGFEFLYPDLKGALEFLLGCPRLRSAT